MFIGLFKVSLLLILTIYLNQSFLCIIFCFLLLKSIKEKLLYILIVSILFIPHHYEIDISNSCRIDKINNSGFICKYDTGSILVYSDKNITYDDVIILNGKRSDIEPFISDYNFNPKQYYNRQYIYEYISDPNIKIIKNGNSLRAKLYNYIKNNQYNTFIKKYIFNINTKDDIISELMVSGYALIGALEILSVLLNLIMDKRYSDLFLNLISFLFMFLYHFTYASIRLVMFQCFRSLKIDNKTRCTIFTIFTCIFFKYQIFSAAFIIPFSFMLISSLGYTKEKLVSININLVLQSILFHQVTPLMIIGYKLIRVLNGFCFLLCFIILFIPIQYDYLIHLITYIYECINLFNIKGSCLSIVLVIIYFISKSFKNRQFVFMCLFLICLYFGYFNPFISFEMINVAQGDSMLIRGPFNSCNILVDTGKNTQYNHLKTTLDAKGINVIDILFISHYDEDHSGNIESLKDDYKVKQIIDKHFESIHYKNFVFYDLNHYAANDNNESSLVLYFEINNTKFLLMGDADKEIERKIINDYNEIDTDILKVGHHGSHTSTSSLFISTIKPSLALISSGLNNRYGHPSQDTIDVLNNNHIPFVNTQTDGDVSIIFTRFIDFMVSNNKKIGIISRGLTNDHITTWKR